MRLVVAAALALSLAACETRPANQLLVRVVDGSGGALRIPDDLDAFEIRVASVSGGAVDRELLIRTRRTWRLTADRTGDAPDSVSLPQSLAVVPSERWSTGTVRVDVLGLRRGRIAQRIHRTVSFGTGLQEVEFALTPLCFGVICPPEQTCGIDGQCRGAEGISDAGVDRDAGPCGPLLIECGDSCIPFDESNCGGCGVACATGERCIQNVCACGPGLTRCAVGCIDVASDPSNCGACDVQCSAPNASTECAVGVCRLTGCDPGYEDCNANPLDGCETALGTMSDCGSCGDVCSSTGGSVSCIGGLCQIGSCNPGRADCNANPTDGCETNIQTIANCGSCGTPCSRAHASENCSSGLCRVGSCNGGWGNCNGNDGDGCEIRLDSLNDCGSCGNRCSYPQAAASCIDGSCEIGNCNADRGNCDGNDGNGCESNLSNDESHCGVCGNACRTNEVCTGGSCTCSGAYRIHMGRCVPSCGALAGGAPAQCCPNTALGCTGGAFGGPPDTWDCYYCCMGVGTCNFP